MGGVQQFNAAVPERSVPFGLASAELSGTAQSGAATVSDVK